MILETGLLFVVTAFAETLGRFVPCLWLRKGGAVWLLLPAAASLALFVWLRAGSDRPGLVAGHRWRQFVADGLALRGERLVRHGDDRLRLQAAR